MDNITTHMITKKVYSYKATQYTNIKEAILRKIADDIDEFEAVENFDMSKDKNIIDAIYNYPEYFEDIIKFIKGAKRDIPISADKFIPRFNSKNINLTDVKDY